MQARAEQCSPRPLSFLTEDEELLQAITRFARTAIAVHVREMDHAGVLRKEMVKMVQPAQVCECAPGMRNLRVQSPCARPLPNSWTCHSERIVAYPEVGPSETIVMPEIRVPPGDSLPISPVNATLARGMSPSGRLFAR